MARPWAGIRIAVACTVFSALWLAAGPAQAGGGDLVGAVGGAGGGAVPDPVGDGVDGTVGQVTGSSDPVLKDTVQKARGDATRLSQTAAELLRDIPRDVGSEPQNDPATPAADTSSDASSNAPRQRQKAVPRSLSAERDRWPPLWRHTSKTRASPGASPFGTFSAVRVQVRPSLGWAAFRESSCRPVS